MADLKIERRIAAPPERVFAHLTEEARIVTWWGHDETDLLQHSLDFSQPGPWFFELGLPSGGLVRASGQVARVDPPTALELTWAWHDETGQRGAESRVTFTLIARDGGTDLTLHHRDLPEEQAQGQERGWVSVMTRFIDRIAANSIQQRGD